MKRDRAPAHNSGQSNEKSARRKVDDASASSSSAASTGSDSYDVFLSFSGQDTRKTFADHLYNGLFDASIRVFRDNNELREGEKIGTNLLQAIKNSKISIPILSQNYASSKWCLQELVEMTECIKSGHVVLPIFYHVEPTDVRNQTGSFGEAFSCLSRKYPEDVEKWKVALQEVASLKGWESEKTADGREGDLVKMVIRKVLGELKKAFQLVVPEQLVGIDNAVQNVLRLLDDNSSAIQIVGVYGMGGIGKTTLAKVVHNNLSNQFQHRSFIADIRESSRNGIFYLQNQLIRDLKEKDQASNKDEGISLLGSRFKRKKVLILLDDVDDIEQIRALIGKYDWFERGSRIIITTRIRSVLDDAEVNCQYELKELAQDKSLILFSRHAFRRDSPLCEFESLSRAIVSTAGGLPLALQVIGSSLCGKKQEFWQEVLKKLQKAPHEKVQEKLKISYDALNYAEKQIFLDIACFFNGFDLRIVSYMWDACGYHPKMEIDILSFRSLIKIGEDGKVQMHDQLRDLGREIVHEEDYDAPINRSRLWVYEEAMEVLKRNKGNREACVQALRLDEDYTGSEFSDFSSELERKFTTEQFETLPKLRFLAVHDAKLTGDSRSLLPRLLWLAWRGCPAFVATSFCLKKLVILDLSSSDISELWEGWSHLKIAKHLKVLDLSNCHYLKVTPDLSAFRSLEIFQLKACRILKQIHPSIGKAEKLVSLDLRECCELQELPQEMGVFGFHGTFDKVSCLEKLILDGCHMLQSLPELPTSLTVLEVSGRHGTFPQLSRLIHLEILTVKDCPLLKSMPELPSRLLKLYVRYCGELKELPSLSRLELLSELFLESCGELTEIRGLEGLKSLEYLTLSECWKLSNPDLDGLEHLESLGDLRLSSSGSILQDDQVRGFEKLKNLQFDYRIPNSIWKLECLTILDLSYSGICELSKSIGDLNLEFLDISHCEKLSSLPSTIGKLGNLEELYAANCKNLGGEIHIDGLSSLKILHLSSTGVSGFHGTFDKVSCLEQLMLDDCHMLQSLPELPTSLTVLEVSGQHRTFPQLSHLIHLKSLTVKDCPLLKSMPELPSKLLKLHVRCGELKELPSLSRLELLSELYLESCGELTEIRGLEGLKSLARLIVIKCWKLSNLDGLEHLESLRYLLLSLSGSILKDDQVRGFEKLKNLRFDYRIPNSIWKLECLTVLDLSYLGICELSKSIGDLKNLKFLDISHCEKLSSLPSTIGKLGNLEELDASNCKNLGGEIHIDGLSSLKILHLSSTGVSGFHGTFDKFSCLEKLILDNCHMLQSLPELPTSLTVLKVSGQHGTFPQLSHLIHLKSLTVKDCPLLKSMPELPSRLLKLYVRYCGELKEIPSLSRLELLSELYLESCGELTEIRGLEGLKSLGWLTVRECWKLSNLDGLEHLESLRDLCLLSSGSILKDDQVRGFEKLKNLKRLVVVGCESLVRVDVSQLTHLDGLDFCGCCKLLEIKGLERLKNLITLILAGCPIDTLPDLSCLHNLEHACVDERSNIPDVRGVRRAKYVGNGLYELLPQ